MKFGYVHRNSPIATVNSVYGPWFLFLTTKCFLCSGHLENYTSDYTIQVLVGYCSVYIFMQTFMIPGTIFMSLLAGSLFGQLRGVALVVFAASAGASSCFFLSKLIGKPLVFSLWPDKLMFFQKQVAKRREKLLNYMLFLRVTPTLPNTFINLASPIVDVPYHIFLLATLIGLIPASYVTVRAGIALGELTSLSDLYDTQSIALLFLIGIVSVTPTLLGKDEAQEKTTEIAVTASWSQKRRSACPHLYIWSSSMQGCFRSSRSIKGLTTPWFAKTTQHDRTSNPKCFPDPSPLLEACLGCHRNIYEVKCLATQIMESGEAQCPSGKAALMCKH